MTKVNDDMEVYAPAADVNCDEEIKKYRTLRHQAEKEDDNAPYLSMADFIVPNDSVISKYMEMFDVGIVGAEDLSKEYKDGRRLKVSCTKRRKIFWLRNFPKSCTRWCILIHVYADMRMIRNMNCPTMSRSKLANTALVRLQATHSSRNIRRS